MENDVHTERGILRRVGERKRPVEVGFGDLDPALLAELANASARGGDSGRARVEPDRVTARARRDVRQGAAGAAAEVEKAA
jgi:hypothetical protein